MLLLVLRLLPLLSPVGRERSHGKLESIFYACRRRRVKSGYAARHRYLRRHSQQVSM
jgi:hypothetical protein